MSYSKEERALCSGGDGSIELRIAPQEKDIGDLIVRRVLPSPKRKMVGPFIFFDHFGPADFPPGQGIQVRPHPHIGIATITYLFEGEIMHRDSLGYVQPIRAGAVNLMTAGRGIVHSERAGDDFDSMATLHGIQSWMALPDDSEEIEPAFRHYPADELPGLELDGAEITVIMGEAYGKLSPVTAHAATLYLDCRLPRGSVIELPDSYEELGVYVVSGELCIDGGNYEGHVMAVAAAGKPVLLEALADSRVMVVGGEPVGRRTIYWNFVSSTKERIEQARQDWAEGRFASVPGDDEFIPLPD